MHTLHFYGASDDLVYARGTNLHRKREITVDYDEHAAFRVASPDGQGLIVFVQYLGRISGTWTVGVAPLPGPQPLPEWPMQWRFGEANYEEHLESAMQGLAPAPCPPYSTQLELTVPDDAVVVVVRPRNWTGVCGETSPDEG